MCEKSEIDAKPVQVIEGDVTDMLGACICVLSAEQLSITQNSDGNFILQKSPGIRVVPGSVHTYDLPNK
jgi:hypothetical protein